jgi:hypothetical protein
MREAIRSATIRSRRHTGTKSVRNWRNKKRVMSKSPATKIDPELDARKSGTFKIGDVVEVTRLGFGAMRITGKGIFGPPEDRDEAVATLKRVPELGINFIDTADSYGPEVKITTLARM